MKSKSKFNRLASLATLTVTLSAAPLASAATLYWDGNSSTINTQSDNTTTTGQNWLSGGLWDDGATSAAVTSWTAGDNAIFGGAAASQTITAGTLTVGNMTFGSGALGAGTTGTAYTLTGGTITLSSSTITTNTNTTISSTLTGASSLTKAGNANLTLTTKNNYSGGTTVNAGTLYLSSGLNNGTSTAGTSNLVVNSAGIVVTTQDNELGHSNTANMGKLVVNGGTFTANSAFAMWMKSFDMTGGTVNGSGGLDMRFASTITTFASAATATISCPLVLSTDTTLAVADGAATSDLTISGKISSTGKLTKNGAGTVVLGGANSYTGATTINAGTLALSGAATLASSDITVKNNSGFQVDATGKTLKSLAVEGGSTLSLAAGAGTTTVTNALTFTATPAFTVRPGFGSTPVIGTYNLLSPASISGTAGTITTDMTTNGATRVVGSTAVSDGKLVLTISSGGDAQTWTNGAATGVWALNADLNFTGPNDGRFMTYDSVTFGDTAAGPVTLAGALAPSAVTVASASDYTFTGSGLIAGSASLTKSGAGRLTINTANTHSGAINLNGGIITLGSATALGSGGAITFGGSTLQYTAASTTDYSARFSTATGQNYRIDTNGQNVTFATALTGTGNILTKSGGGTLTLSAQNSYAGGTVVNGGTLTLAAGAATGCIRGPLAINSGATVIADTNWSLGYSTGATAITITDGTLNFIGTPANGGTFAPTITMTAGTISGSVFDWYNGNKTLTTLASSTTTSTISSGINLRLGSSNTLTFDVAKGTVPAGPDLLVSGAIAQTGGGNIAKSGLGTMELSGATTYNGSTTINGGTLVLSGAATLANTSGVTVASGARLDVTGLAAPFNLAAAKTLSVGSTSVFAADIKGNLVCKGNLHLAGTGNIAGTLTQTGNLTLDAATAKFDLNNTLTPGAGVNDFINVTGDVTLANVTTININKIGGTLAAGSYTLLSCTGALTGDTNNLTLNLPDTARQSYALETTANSVLLNVTGIAASLKWNGTDLTNPTFWDDTTANWTGGPDGKFANGDLVLFNDDATGSTTVDLQGFLAPESTTFNNSTAKPYSIIGAGGIDGPGGITKNGNGIVTIATDNAYAGPTTIHAGTISVADVTNTNSTGPLGKGNLIALGDTTTTGTLQFTGPTDSTNRPASLAAGGGVLDVTTAGTTLTLSGLISGDGGLTKTGDGILSLSTQNTYTGGTTVNAGTLTLGAAASTGIIRGALTINNGGTVSTTTNWGLGHGDGGGSYITSITITGGTLNFTGTPADGGTAANTITMTGGTISGSMFDWFKGNKTLTTLASSTTATISSGINLRLSQYTPNQALTFDVAAGTVPGGGADLLVSGAILQGGGGNIIKSGLGTMTLTGANTYTGPTTVNAGTLIIDNSLGNTAVAVESGATLGGIGTIGGAVNIKAGAFVAPGNTGARTLTVASATLAGTYNCELGTATGDSVAVTGTLTVSSGATIAITGSPEAPSYTIATYGTLSGSLPIVTGVPTGYAIDTATAGQIKLVKTGGFSSWIAKSEFGLALADQDPTDDPDNDGVNNLVEYAIAGRNPAVSDGAPGSFNGSLLNFTKRTEAAADTKITYAIQESDDLGLTDMWTEAPTGPSYINNATTISYTLPTGKAKTFARLVVTQAP